MKQAARVALCALYKYSGAMHAQELIHRLSGKPCSAILLFHRVTDAIPEDGLTVGTAWFRRFCGLMQRSFHVVPLAEICRQLRAGEQPKPRTMAITFDDCYRDNLFAARVLHEHHLPATFFVPSAFVNTDHVFPWDQNLPRMANLSWNDLAEMVSLGHEIGSHSVSHPDFGRVSPEQARTELIVSRQTLEAHLGGRIRFFAYPFGGKENCPENQVDLIRETGYEACFSGYGGFLTPGSQPKMVPRMAMPYFRSLLHLELYLRGCLGWFHAIKRFNCEMPVIPGIPRSTASEMISFPH